MIKNNKENNKPVCIYRDKINFTCKITPALGIILYYIDFNKDKYCHTRLYTKTRDLLYKYFDPIVEFSIDYMDNIVKELSKDEDQEFSTIIIEAIEHIKPFLKQHYDGKNNDFENIFTQKDNSFLLYFQNKSFNEFFYLIAWNFYICSSGTPLINNEDHCFSILNYNFKNRFFILPILNKQKTYENKISDLFILHSKFITDNSNCSSFFILYTKKEHLNNFNYDWIGNIITLKDDKNDFTQRYVKFNH